MARIAPQLIALLSLSLAPAPALAGSTTGVATLTPGTAHPERLVIDGKAWRCADGVCRGPAELRAVAVERTCKDLAKKVGALETLTIGGMTLEGTQLANCSAKGGTTEQQVAKR